MQAPNEKVGEPGEKVYKFERMSSEICRMIIRLKSPEHLVQVLLGARVLTHRCRDPFDHVSYVQKVTLVTCKCEKMLAYVLMTISDLVCVMLPKITSKIKSQLFRMNIG